MLTQFDLGSVGGFGWSEKQKELEQLQECAAANITVADCELGSQALDLSVAHSLVHVSIQRCSSAQGLEFPWPEEVTQAMDGVFELMKIMCRSQPGAVLAETWL